MASRIWVDVEDLFLYATGARRPSGIQRLVFELTNALRILQGPEDVRFLRHGNTESGFTEVPWAEVKNLFAELTGSAPPPPQSETSPPRRWLLRRGVGQCVLKLVPRQLRPATARFLGLQFQAVLAFASLAWEGVQPRTWWVRPEPVEPPCNDPIESFDNFERQVVRGDTLFAPGAGWIHPRHAEMVARAKRVHGVRFVLLVYDLIPLRRPEWVGGAHTAMFRNWCASILPLCNALLTISNASAADLRDWTQRAGVVTRVDPQVIPIGSGFAATAMPKDAPSRPLPAPGSYALFVSTIEARKNHALLFRVWRRLLEELPEEEVPALVFAGKPGGLSGDLIAQLHNSDFLDGKIVLIPDASDADLTALYRGCLFTLFPSLYEGWGLPVTESLSFGKPCLAGNGTSLPEAGGDLARYFDAEDLSDATRVIRATIKDRAGLAAWEADVRRRFRPVSWSASAEALLPMLLGHGDEAAQCGASKPPLEHAELVSAVAMCPLEPYLA